MVVDQIILTLKHILKHALVIALFVLDDPLRYRANGGG
jgi:hypothetical protein